MTTIEVEGMSCGGCVNSVSKIILRTGGFSPDDVTVELEGKVAHFPKTDEDTTGEILAGLQKAGFPAKRQGS